MQHKKTHVLPMAAAGVAIFINGCAARNPRRAWRPHCPKPAHKQGYLILEKDKTRKCHALTYSHYMPCRGMTNSTGKNGLVCGNVQGAALYLFDEQDLLPNHRIFQR